MQETGARGPLEKIAVTANSILISPGAVVLRPQQYVHQRLRERQIGLHRACIATATVQETVEQPGYIKILCGIEYTYIVVAHTSITVPRSSRDR